MAQGEQKTSVEWDTFTDAMRKIVTVPHAEIKAVLDEEDKVRRRKRSRSAKVRAFREANKETLK
jgi:hypothetical protein